MLAKAEADAATKKSKYSHDGTARGMCCSSCRSCLLRAVCVQLVFSITRMERDCVFVSHSLALTPTHIHTDDAVDDPALAADAAADGLDAKELARLKDQQEKREYEERLKKRDEESTKKVMGVKIYLAAEALAVLVVAVDSPHPSFFRCVCVSHGVYVSVRVFS